MPLVTRQASQGNLFSQANEPSGWLNGDMWVDTDNSNVAVNRGGTAQQIAPGTTAEGDILFSNGANTVVALNIGTALQVLRTNAGATAPEYADLSTLWSVLGDYEASIAEGSHNFNFTAVDFDDDSKLVLVIDLASTLALNLLLRINTNSTSNYFSDGRRIAAGTETLIDLNTQTSARLASTSLLTADNETVFVAVEIGLQKAVTATRPMMLSSAQGGTIAGNEVVGHRLSVNTASITDIDVLTSTSTWVIGTRMTLYKVARA